LYFYNLRPEAPKININGEKNSGRTGLFTEAKFKLSGSFNAIAGLRSDYFLNPDKNTITFDPRLSLVYRLSEYSFLKAATGIYHQNPGLGNFFYNNISLKPEQAIHYILGYEFNKDADYIFRVEAYYKDYSSLVANSVYNSYLVSEGSGYAKGADVFLKVRLKPRFNGWISYSYTDSKRKEYGTGILTSANYDITHTLSVVGTYNPFGNLTVGATYKVSTGKPYTPVTGSIYDSSQSAYIPIYGATNSDRFPVYQRVDINAQDYFTEFSRFIVIFFALNNIFNQDNLYTYSYNSDYSRKISINSNNFRTVYFGFGIQL